jgi:hypothetical protein
MASATHDGSFGPCAYRAGSVENGLGARLKSLARPLMGALAAQRQREVDRTIARLLAQSGGRLTDSLEREIIRTVFESDWSPPL